MEPYVDYEDNDYLRYYRMYGAPVSDEEYEDILMQCKKIIEI